MPLPARAVRPVTTIAVAYWASLSSLGTQSLYGGEKTQENGTGLPRAWGLSLITELAA